MYSRPTAPLTIGGVIDDAIKLYRASFRHCWQISLLGSLIKGGFGIFLTLRLLGSVGLGAAGMLHAYWNSNVLALVLLDAVLTTGIYGALIAMQDAVGTEQPLTIGQAFGIGFSRVGKALVAGIVASFLIVLGLILLIIPGIYVIGTLCLSQVALFADDAGAMESLDVSRNLVKGHWWRTATILTVAVIIMLVFSMASGLIVGVFALFGHRDLLTTQLLTQAVSAAVYVFILPMMPAALIAIYRDLKLRREGGDLAARVEALPRA